MSLAQARDWFARKLVPDLPKLIEAAGKLPETFKQLALARDTIGFLKETMPRMGMYRTGRGEWRPVSADANDFFEAGLMAGAGPTHGIPDPQAVAKLKETWWPDDKTTMSLKERWWELELALEDRGWQRQLALSQLEFSRYGIQQLILISRLYFLKNPLIRRGIHIVSDYVFGRGIDIRSDDEAANEVIQAFMAANDGELGHSGLTQKDNTLHTDGNLFFVFFTDQSTGEVKLRTIDAPEVQDVMTNPDDSTEPWYYKRVWQQRNFDYGGGVPRPVPMTAWYPAIDYEPTEKLNSIGRDPVIMDQKVFHVKTGGLAKWLFGCPEIYSAIDWARAYKKFLENWCTITDALSRFSWNYETQGGPAAIAAIQQAFATTLAQGGTSIETNPTPVAAAMHATGPGNKLTPFRTAGATTEPEQGRRVALMVCSAFGLPETMLLGDASTGSLATATSLDRPTELKFLRRQEQWRHWLQTILKYVLELSNTSPKGKLKEARKAVGKNGDLSDITITIKFPAVLEHDIKTMVEAIVAGTTLNGFAPAGTIDLRTATGLILAELGVEDVDQVLDAMFPDGEYDPREDTVPPTPEPPIGGAPPAQAQEARMLHAITELRRVSEKLAAFKA